MLQFLYWIVESQCVIMELLWRSSLSRSRYLLSWWSVINLRVCRSLEKLSLYTRLLWSDFNKIHSSLYCVSAQEQKVSTHPSVTSRSVFPDAEIFSFFLVCFSLCLFWATEHYFILMMPAGILHVKINWKYIYFFSPVAACYGFKRKKRWAMKQCLVFLL